MKQGWEIKKIEDLCTVFGDGDWIESKDQSKSGVRLIQTGNIGNAFFKDRGEKARYISESTFKKLRCTEIVEGDCLVSRLPDPVGRVCILPNTGEKMITAVDCTIIRFQPKIILPKWFVFYSLSQEYQIAINSEVSGSTRQRISRKNLGKITIPIPSLKEQQQLVSILEETFSNISMVKDNAEQNLQNSRELYESYLQNIFTNKGKDWKEKTLGDVCSLYQGIAINAKTKHALVKKSNLPLLRIKDLRNNSEEQYIDPNNYPVNALVNEDDIIYTRTGNSLGLVFRGRRGVLHNNSFKIVPNSELDRNYLFIWLQNPIFKSKIFSLASKAAQPDITHAIFKIQEIAIPSIKQQQDIVKKLDTLSVETKRLEIIYQQKLNELEELKKSILQKAFNGELTTTLNKNKVISTTQKIPSPYFRNQVHSAIVEQVVKDGGETTEVAVAKYDHLLQEVFGVNLGYKFETHLFGPFDSTIKRLIFSGFSSKNNWFTKKSGMIVVGENISALLSSPTNLYRDAKLAMSELAKLGVTKMGTDKIELLSTVCHAIKQSKSVDVQQVRVFMDNWQTNNNMTKSQKFSLEQTTKCIDFILKKGLDKRILEL